MILENDIVNGLIIIFSTSGKYCALGSCVKIGKLFKKFQKFELVVFNWLWQYESVPKHTGVSIKPK